MLFQIQNFFMSRSRHDHFPRLSRSETETRHWHSETETLKNETKTRLETSSSDKHFVTIDNQVINHCKWVRRCRRLAGYLFQDIWKDQGRGFIFLPHWPPNCLGQMLTVRDFSQHLVSSSKTIRPNIPRGARCMVHCEMM